MKNKKNNIQVASSEGLNLDPETRGILQSISNRLDKTPPEIIKEIVYSVDTLFLWNNSDENRSTKEDLGFTFNSMIQHLHLLPQISESIHLLSGRDTEIVIGNLEICLEMNTLRFDLGLGIYDLEKIFVTMMEGRIQLFSNRHLRLSNDRDEIEKIKEYAHTKVKESVPYADVTIGLVEYNEMNKRGTEQLAADTIVRVKEIELTIISHNIKYLPTFHKFNVLMDDVVYYFGKHIKNEIKTGS